MAESESYGIVLQHIMRDSSIPVEAKAIYSYLCTFADKDGICYPSVAIMCKELNMSETRFYKNMNHLKLKGIVTVTQCRNGSQFSRNIYVVSRATISPSPRNEGTETRAQDLPSPRNESTKNEGINNPSNNSTSVYNSNRINTYDFVEVILPYLNEGKRKSSCKGRLKNISLAISTIEEILDSAISHVEILQYAKEIADYGLDIQWWEFSDYCVERHKGWKYDGDRVSYGTTYDELRKQFSQVRISV